MIQSMTDLCLPYAAYAGFALAWAAHFFSVRTYSAMARLSKKQKAMQQPDDPKQEEPPVSVIIPACNEAEALRRNLPAILEQDYGNYEVIVVNDASTDETEDLLKALETEYPHLYHTFIPPGSRYVSHERLALTVGAKSANHDWMLLTEAGCRPDSPKWIAAMAKHFHQDTQIVLGYANRQQAKGLVSRKIIFYNLFHQAQYLPWATRHRAYRCTPGNVAYRKSFFMSHKGFAEDVNLLGGAMEILVNRHSRKDNTEVAITPEAKIIYTGKTSSKGWRTERAEYLETRRHFARTFGYRTMYNLCQTLMLLYYLATIVATGWSVWQKEWIGTATVALAFILLSVCKTLWFNRSARAVGERKFTLSFLWHELSVPLWAIRSWIEYHTNPRSRFYRKAF